MALANGIIQKTTRIVPRVLSSLKMPEAEVPQKDIVIYVCPTKGCDDFYGSTGFRSDKVNLKKLQHARIGDEGEWISTHNRLECPMCRARGDRVQRVPYIVTQMVPLEKVLEAQRAISKS